MDISHRHASARAFLPRVVATGRYRAHTRGSDHLPAKGSDARSQREGITGSRYPREEIISISGSVGLAERCSAISEIVCLQRRDNALSRILFVYLTTIALLSPARFGVELFLANTLIGCPISIAIEKARQVHNRTRTRKSSNGTVVVVVVVIVAVVVIAYESKYRLKFNF